VIAHEFHEVAPFAALVDDDGYLPLEDHGLIGDGETAALVGRDGAISWLCLPRFDSPPLFCSILDHRRGGRFVVAPDGLTESRQRYEPDTGVLVTEMRAPFGLVRVTDALTLRRGADLTEDAPAARGELLRSIVVLDGEVNLRIGLQPRGGASGSRRAFESNATVSLTSTCSCRPRWRSTGSTLRWRCGAVSTPTSRCVGVPATVEATTGGPPRRCRQRSTLGGSGCATSPTSGRTSRSCGARPSP